MVDIYRFRVRGHLKDRWSDWLGGLAVQRHEDGTTVLVGPVVDQAALHGVIIRIRDLGLILLSVSLVSESHTNALKSSMPTYNMATLQIKSLGTSD